jgi:uncharacterized membrane-anchored protein
MNYSSQYRISNSKFAFNKFGMIILLCLFIWMSLCLLIVCIFIELNIYLVASSFIVGAVSVSPFSAATGDV